MTASSAMWPEQWVEELLGFWFGELTYQQWFKKDDAVDEVIAARFRDLHVRIAAEPLPEPLPAPREVLARIVALDQLPRNLYRGTPRAFETDAKALQLARRAVTAGIETELSLHERMFVYLPFEHSEMLADQEMSVRLFATLGDAELTRFAERHREIIARFGRFPHRNAVVGRLSTPEEIAFLQEPNSAF